MEFNNNFDEDISHATSKFGLNESVTDYAQIRC